MKIGIMGGTFDPIHNGHIEMAEFCKKKFSLDKIMFLPVGDAPHKKNVSDKNIRIEMIKSAIEYNDDFFLSTVETDRVGKTYSFDTLKYLKETTADDYFFIIGGDTVNTLDTWYRYTDVLKMTEFIVVLREQSDISQKAEMLEKQGAIFHFADHTGLNISSTEIREKVRNGISVKDETGEKVVEIIEKYGLYKN